MSNSQLPSLMLSGRDTQHLVTLMSTSSDAHKNSNDPTSWSESHKDFVIRQQERYLKRLAEFREALLRQNRDLIQLHLPKASERKTGFWEAVMADLADNPSRKKMQNSQSFHPSHSLIGGYLSDEPNRRGHLERLRRIRIMQKRRRLPPQLGPLHGVGLGTKTEERTNGNKTITKVPTTAYHVDWMRGNHIITPNGVQEKAMNSWTLKHLRTVDTLPGIRTSDLEFPNDIRELLRRTRRSIDTTIKEKTASSNNSPVPKTQTPSHSRLPSESIRTQVSIPPLTPPFPPPPPTTSPTPVTMIDFLRDSARTKSEVSVNMEEGGDMTEDDDVTIASLEDSESVEVVDKATSPVGFRLPPLATDSPHDNSPSAKLKRHIIVKIPNSAK